VLLVDDDRSVLRLLRVLSEAANLEPHCAGDGVEALELLAEGLEPVAVVTDIEMPRMDGIELARHIRAMPALAGVRVIAHSGREASREALAVTDCYLPKGEPKLLQRVLRAI
jgi:chemosensory pili system protein ChpA (sensor histidine kinase/response regulator)